MKFRLSRRERHGRPIPIGPGESLEDARHSRELAMEAARTTNDRVDAFIVIDEDDNEVA
jgi:hypothetical protein